jgi:hypothetical protein
MQSTGSVTIDGRCSLRVRTRTAREFVGWQLSIHVGRVASSRYPTAVNLQNLLRTPVDNRVRNGVGIEREPQLGLHAVDQLIRPLTNTARRSSLDCAHSFLQHR